MKKVRKTMINTYFLFDLMETGQIGGYPGRGLGSGGNGVSLANG